MLQVYYDRLVLPQTWKLPSQFIRSVNKNSTHTEVDSFTKQLKPTRHRFIFPNKIRNVLLHEKCLSNKSKYIYFLIFLVSLNEHDSDEIACFL